MNECGLKRPYHGGRRFGDHRQEAMMIGRYMNAFSIYLSQPRTCNYCKTGLSCRIVPCVLQVCTNTTQPPSDIVHCKILWRKRKPSKIPFPQFCSCTVQYRITPFNGLCFSRRGSLVPFILHCIHSWQYALLITKSLRIWRELLYE